MDGNNNENKEFGSVFDSIMSSSDKSVEDLASLATGNGGIMEVEFPDTSSDSESGEVFEDTISESMKIQATEQNHSTEKLWTQETLLVKLFPLRIKMRTR